MRNILSAVLIVLFLIFSTVLHSTDKLPPDYVQLITDRFSKQWIEMPQEKLYLQTDKPYYSAGENIWFKGYLVNATTLEPNALSQFIYVELIDKSDSVLYRTKIKKDSLGFSGYIKLKPETPSGYYSLRGYTYWMQNTPPEFFFSRNVLIGNEIDKRISSAITYGTPEKGLIPVTLSFRDATQNPVAGKRFEIIQHWKSAQEKKLELVTDYAGKINLQIAINPGDTTRKRMDVSQGDDKYKNTFYLPEFSRDFDIQFFPESGVLLNNDLQSIAFKAIGRDGLSVEVSGKICNSKNEVVTEFTTLHKGMGKFVIQTQPGESYYGLVKTTTGIEKRVELPKSEGEAIAIHLVVNKGKIFYKVLNQTGIPVESLYLLLHSRGEVYVLQSLKNPEGQISESMLPPGIVSISVIDSLGHIFCERLSFIRNNNYPMVTMESDKATYGKREPVSLDLSVKSAAGKPVEGSFSISITDNQIVKPDSLADNIMSYLLLSSDIKGYIEDPAAYFADTKVLTREKMEVLMMTQGWRRFNTADVIKGVFKQPAYYMEEGQALSGKVLNIFNKPSRKSDVIMFSPSLNTLKIVRTDSLGRYLIDGIEFPDSTSFVLKARKPKSITGVEIIPDQDLFPRPNVFIPTLSAQYTPAQEDYFKQSKERYYCEGGMAVHLKEILVKAVKIPEKHKEYYSGMADNEITSEQLEKFPSMSVKNFLYTIPGVLVSGDKISIRGSMSNPLILVDNIEMPDLDEISYLTATDVESISVFKGANTAIFGSRGGNGVIAIELKKGYSQKTATSISMAHISPLGYQKAVQFYVPKYEVDSLLKSSQPDLRTTIYWNPKLVPDSTGTIHVKFYTADTMSDYSVILEGITNSGELCRYVGCLKRNGHLSDLKALNTNE